MPNYQKKIVYLSEEQKDILFSEGEITVEGQTVVFNENDMYVTPQNGLGLGAIQLEGDKYRIAGLENTGGSVQLQDYEELTNKPSINNVTLIGNKSLHDIGLGPDVAEEVTSWLDENVESGETLVVDNSLTIQGAAADAKKTGDEISEIKSANNARTTAETFTPTAYGSSVYTYSLVSGKWYKVVNNGTKGLFVRSKNSGTLTEQLGQVEPGNALFFSPSSTCNQIDFYRESSESTASVTVYCGTDIDEQAVVHKGLTSGMRFYPKAAEANTYRFNTVAGKWYKITNEGPERINVSFTKNNVLNQLCGAVFPGKSIFVKATDNCDRISIYAFSAQQTASVLVSEGEICSPQSNEGTFDVIWFAPTATDSTVFTYTLAAGKGYRADNYGSKTVYVRSKQAGTLKERFGTVAPGESLYFLPTETCNQIDFWRVDSDSNAKIAIVSGEIIESQISASNVSNNLRTFSDHITFKVDRIDELLNRGFVRYNFPDSFTWNENPIVDKVITDGRGKFIVNYHVMDHVSTTGVDVYVAPDGNDANNGLTPGTPKKSLSSAIGVANARRVHIAGGYYPRQDVTLTGDIDFIGDPDNRPVFTSQLNAIEWTATGTNGVYTTGHMNNSYLYDLTSTDSSGAYRTYTQEVSVSAVASAPGTYYDDGTTVTLHTYNDVAASLETICYTAGFYSVRIKAAGHQALIANLRLLCGGTYSEYGQFELTGDSTNRGTYLVYNCDSSHSLTPTTGGGGGFHPSNADVIIHDCTAYYTGNDAFSYGSGCKVVEFNCVSAYNGRPGNITSCNGSTGHGGSIVRIGSAYHDTYGPIVHDVGATDSVNLGLTAWHSTCEGKPNFCASGGTVKMWLDSCVSYSSDRGIDVGKPDEAAANAVIYKRNCTSDVDDGEYGGHIYRY